MDNNRAKLLLDKINGLFRNLNLDANQISSVERDLMLSYIRDLYDAVLEQPSSQASRPKSSPTMPKERKEPDFEIVKPKEEKSTIPPKIIEIEEPSPEPKDSTAQPPKPPAKPKDEASKLSPAKSKTSPDNTFEQLFEQKRATELSEKLSESPITDLTRAMSINDRLLYMNELFGKDIQALNETLKLLNKYDNIEEAKGLLANLADQYTWLDDEKINIAREFIKLVRRRYH